MKPNPLQVLILITGTLLCGLFSGCSGSSSGNPNPSISEKTDPNLYVSGYIVPVNSNSSAIGSHNYYGWVIIDDVTTGSPVPITDATVTINGQPAIFSTTYGEYVLPSITGSYNVGSTFTVAISHPRVVLTRTLTVPTTVVPATYTINPLFDNTSNKILQNITYTITPTTSWANFGCIFAYLYGTGTTTPVGYYYYTSLTTGAQFTSSNLSLGTPPVLSQNVSFAAWSVDKLDLVGFNATSPSRLRVWAPNGTTIAQNF
jgi:hypothetical protein